MPDAVHAASSIRLNEDHHVHSTFSDGTDTLERNVAVAADRGLTHLGCVDHVRRDTTYVPQFVQAVRRLKAETAITMTVGIEAKILDVSGTLDLPDDTGRADLVYIADHQFPGETGPISPRIMREALAASSVTPAGAIRALVSATIGALERGHANGHRLVLAHLFSILPKLGLDESSVPEDEIQRLVAAARQTATTLEVSERWRCPSDRVILAALREGVAVVASTDSHRATDIGRYEYVAAVAARLGQAGA